MQGALKTVEPPRAARAGGGPGASGGSSRGQGCLTEEQTLAFIEGRLSRPRIARIDAHLCACVLCNAVVLEALHLCEAAPCASSSLARRSLAFEVGTKVAGRYLIRRSLGQGGMGDVYEAFDLDRHRTVALKTVKATACDNPEATRRLLSELALARRIRHPNVCRVDDVGVHEDVRPRGAQLSFITMELIPGESLAWRLRLGALAPADVQVLGRELLLGVAAIHRAGVIHRDLKSANVMLRDDPHQLRVAIIDFSLAVSIDHGQSPLTPAPSEHPSSFSFEGSPRYMAPEQFRNVPVTPAADVFASGVVLFEALTGSLPFRSCRGNASDSVHRQPDEPPLRPSDVTSNVSASLDDFIARCLDPNPARRFPDAGAALDALAKRW